MGCLSNSRNIFSPQKSLIHRGMDIILLSLCLLTTAAQVQGANITHCEDTGCKSYYSGEAQCVYVREANFTAIGREFDLTTVNNTSLCRGTTDDCCRCFRRLPPTPPPPPTCTDVDGSCNREFGGYGACIDVRYGNLTDIDIDVNPLENKCGATHEKCCLCFSMKTEVNLGLESWKTSSSSMSSTSELHRNTYGKGTRNSYFTGT